MGLGGGIIVGSLLSLRGMKTQAKTFQSAANASAEAQRESTQAIVDLQREIQKQNLDMYRQNFRNLYNIGKNDFLNSEKAKAMISAITYGTPIQYTTETLLQEGTGESGMPEVVTIKGQMTPEEATRMMYENEAFKRRQRLLNDVMASKLSAMGLNRGSSASAIGETNKNLLAEEEQNYLNKLARIAGYDTGTLPQASQNTVSGMTNVLANTGGQMSNAYAQQGANLSNIFYNAGMQNANLIGQKWNNMLNMLGAYGQYKGWF